MKITIYEDYRKNFVIDTGEEYVEIPLEKLDDFIFALQSFEVTHDKVEIH